MFHLSDDNSRDRYIPRNRVSRDGQASSKLLSCRWPLDLTETFLIVRRSGYKSESICTAHYSILSGSRSPNHATNRAGSLRKTRRNGQLQSDQTTRSRTKRTANSPSNSAPSLCAMYAGVSAPARAEVTMVHETRKKIAESGFLIWPPAISVRHNPGQTATQRTGLVSVAPAASSVAGHLTQSLPYRFSVVVLNTDNVPLPTCIVNQ